MEPFPLISKDEEASESDPELDEEEGVKSVLDSNPSNISGESVVVREGEGANSNTTNVNKGSNLTFLRNKVSSCLSSMKKNCSAALAKKPANQEQ